MLPVAKKSTMNATGKVIARPLNRPLTRPSCVRIQLHAHVECVIDVTPGGASDRRDATNLSNSLYTEISLSCEPGGRRRGREREREMRGGGEGALAARA